MQSFSVCKRLHYLIHIYQSNWKQSISGIISYTYTSEFQKTTRLLSAVHPSIQIYWVTYWESNYYSKKRQINKLGSRNYSLKYSLQIMKTKYNKTYVVYCDKRYNALFTSDALSWNSLRWCSSSFSFSSKCLILSCKRTKKLGLLYKN